MKKFILSIGLLLGALSLSAESVVYVAPEACGDGTGSSWANAMGDIQSGIREAKKDVTGQTVVWVKGGTYNLAKHIVINDSVSIYGSFAGTETALEQRAKNSDAAWDFANPTILDGQDTITCIRATKNMTVPVVIDGFVAQHGRATKAHNESGGGVRLYHNVTLQNSIVRNCHSEQSSGGIQVSPGGNVYNCLVENNSQENDANGGGGINVNTSSGGFEVQIEGCVIRGNTSDVRGGGINCQGQTATYINACRIYNNSAVKADGTLAPGGAIYDNGAQQSHITNCAIYNNTGSNAIYLKANEFINNTVVKNVGGIYIVAGTSTALVCNNIVWACYTAADQTTATSIGGNNITGMKVFYNFTYNPVPDSKGWVLSASEEIPNTNMQFVSNNTNGDTDPTTVDADKAEGKSLVGPHFVNLSSFAGAVPAEGLTEVEKAELLAELDEVDLHIDATSALLNAGMAVETLTSDLEGNNRPQGERYDVGAYELPYFDVLIGEYAAEEGEITDEFGMPIAAGSTLSCISGSPLRLYLLPAEGDAPYQIFMVKSNDGGLTFEGEEQDITSLFDAELLTLDIRVEYSFKLKVVWKKMEESISNTEANTLRVMPMNHGVVVSGLQEGVAVEVFDINGRAVYSEVARAERMDIMLETGMYIIRQGASRAKAIVK